MSEPVFRSVLADDWHQLGEIIRKHYFLRPFSNDYICVTGEMSEIHHSFIAKLIIPFGLLFGAVVPYRGKSVPIDVHYNSRKDDANIYWDRVFKFSDKRHFHFKSHMEHVRNNEVIEFVRFGVGIRLRVTAENGAVVFRGVGYVWRLCGNDIPIPAGLLLGEAYVEERPISDDNFSMKMTLTHPLFGVMFRYQGSFELGQRQTE